MQLAGLGAAQTFQLAPAPGLADLERLVSTTAGAGVRAALTRTGDRRDIPAAIDQSAFRIVQEALTNVVKHSGASTCQVIVGYEPDSLTVEITDSGALPFSTQSITALSMSKWSSDGPPPQWAMPGMRKMRLHSATLSAPPFVVARDL